VLVSDDKLQITIDTAKEHDYWIVSQEQVTEPTVFGDGHGGIMGLSDFLCQSVWEWYLQAQLRAGSRFSKMIAKWFNASLQFRIGIVHFLDASWMAR
jgi:hypothetical protein